MSERVTVDQEIKAVMDKFEAKFCVKKYRFATMKLDRHEEANLMTLGIMFEDPNEQIQASTNISGLMAIFDRDVEKYEVKQIGDGWSFFPAVHKKSNLNINMFIRDFIFK